MPHSCQAGVQHSLIVATRMTPLAQPRRITIVRCVLLLAGCMPMVLVHGVLSLLTVLPLLGLVCGDLREGLFLLWWFIGTSSLAVLVYSSASFTRSSRPLPLWQVLGLIVGIILAIPLIFGFIGEWWASVCATLACSAAVYILDARGPEPSSRADGKAPDSSDAPSPA